MARWRNANKRIGPSAVTGFIVWNGRKGDGAGGPASLGGLLRTAAQGQGRDSHSDQQYRTGLGNIRGIQTHHKIPRARA